MVAFCWGKGTTQWFSGIHFHFKKLNDYMKVWNIGFEWVCTCKCLDTCSNQSEETRCCLNQSEADFILGVRAFSRAFLCLALLPICCLNLIGSFGYLHFVCFGGSHQKRTLTSLLQDFTVLIRDFLSLFIMFSVQAAAGVVNTAVNDQLAVWMETEKDHFFLGKVSSHQKRIS